MILRSRWGLKFLLKLDVAKATGPDSLPARILKEVAKQIYMPLIVLCRRILIEGHWPATWRLHRLCPLYKRNSVYDANSYRGVHITSILSKVAERIIGGPLVRYFEIANCPILISQKRLQPKRMFSQFQKLSSIGWMR